MSKDHQGLYSRVATIS